jgi:regulator of sigma E protease
MILAFLMLSTLIFIHELGHFLAAKYFRVNVKEFAIGFGPKFLYFKWKKTLFSFRAIPLGGFVDISGIDSGAKSGFNIKPYYQKLIILLAGVINNLLFSFITFFFLSIHLGLIDKNSNKIQTVFSKISILKKGDELIKVNEIDIKSWSEVENALKEIDQDFKIEIIRDKNLVKLEVPIKDKLNVLFGALPTKSSILGSFIKASKLTFDAFIKCSTIIKKLFRLEINKDDVSGPIGMVKTMQDNSVDSILKIFILAAFISINIAFFNLLPLPPFDGGKILIITLKKFFKINRNIEMMLNFFGTFIILFLSILIGKNDIQKLRGVKIEKKIESIR